jgi:hypothetical protein
MFLICCITLTIKFTSDILKFLYYVIVTLLYIILRTVEKNTHFHDLIIILLYYHFFHIPNPIIYTKS